MELVVVRRGCRQGVLLLVVLSMLTLFLLLGTTFIVLSSRARTVSRAFLKLAEETQQQTISLRPFLQDAARQVIRGTTFTGSALRSHDLLGDKYDHSYETQIDSVTLLASSQVLKLRLANPDDDMFAARVLSFLEGPEGVKGTSHRIFHADGTDVYILRPKRLVNADSDSLNHKTVRINKRDFSGTGFLTGTDEALMPNWSLVPSEGPGGSRNEDYDYWDEQNVVLASPDQTSTSYAVPAAVDHWIEWYRTQEEAISPDKPSREAAQGAIFELANNLRAATFSGQEQATSYFNGLQPHEQDVLKYLRRSTLRPFPFDHCPDVSASVDFAGQAVGTANEFFNVLQNADPDVDCDGDGRPDAVWLDFGVDAIRLPDRTLVKPLVAIRCIDLGGRLSLNAHGSIAHLIDHAGYPFSATDDRSLARTFADADTPPDDQDINDLNNERDLVEDQTSGCGYGPADVRLDAVLNQQTLEAVLLGRSSLTLAADGLKRRLGNIAGRYGDGVKAIGDPALPGKPEVDDGQLPPWAYASGGLPTDYWGQSTIGRDHRGHPFKLNRLTRPDNTDNPYEIDLLAFRDGNPYVYANNHSRWWVDQPFTAAELEALLRRKDPDVAALVPQRALAIALSSNNSADLLTTDSWRSPAVIGTLPASLGSRNLELKDGIRLNLNRPFGDGADNDGDGEIDEPDETDPGKVPEDRDLYGGKIFASDPTPNQPTENDNDREGEGWLLTRGQTIIGQPGPDLPGLRARQIHADNIFRLLKFINAPFLSEKELAQWAVNIVDFIDADRAMTPYKYSAADETHDFVVWGCERPQAIITETLAFHDRAIADTNKDTSEQAVSDSDEDFDQLRVPQGSLFVELQAIDPNGVNLSETNSANDPVWRLAISELHSEGTTTNDPFHILTQYSGTESFAPSDGVDGEGVGVDNLNGANLKGVLRTTRYVWFTNRTPPEGDSSDNSPNKWNTFWPRDDKNGQLAAGQFLVIGPRNTTYLGGCSTGYQPSPQKTVLNSGGFVGVRSVNSNANVNDRINPSRSSPGGGWPDFEIPATGFPETKIMVCRSANAAGWDCAGWENENYYESDGMIRYYPVGLNISEPRADNYYIQPAAPNSNSLSTPGYGRLADGDINSSMARYPDTPKDAQEDSPLFANDPELLRQGTHSNVATVFLQRLADPSRPYDPAVKNGDSSNPNWNPYIVVDFFPIDLHVFNGETDQDDPSVGSKKDYYFHTRQRGFDAWLNQTGTTQGSPPDEEASFNLDRALFSNLPDWNAAPWRPPMPWKDSVVKPPQPQKTVPGSVTTSVTPCFRHNLGYTGVDHTVQDTTVPFHSLGFASAAYGRRLIEPEVPEAYAGASIMTPSWIVWKDSPLANPYEVLLVPRTPASRLLTNYRDFDGRGSDPDHPYGATMPGHHLMPFTSDADENGGATANALVRLFSYVRTESPFAGTVRHLELATDDETQQKEYRPPFDRIPTFREPGAVNLNTITDERVWRGLLGDYKYDGSWATDQTVPAWATDILARRQTRPFRSANKGRQATLFDENGRTGDEAGPLFPAPGGRGEPAFEPKKSAWFRFEPLIRAASNTTPRSEVYAIWLTLGLFEVESTKESVPDPLGWKQLDELHRYPQGYRLKREYGSVSGEVKRYRAFYIVDRSRPVCYEEGADHNVADTILIERFID